jgi:hypothetical protein
MLQFWGSILSELDGEIEGEVMVVGFGHSVMNPTHDR